MEREINDSITNIEEPVLVDNSIESLFYTDWNLQTKADINNDNAHLEFSIQANDRFLVPSRSYIVITGKLVQAAYDIPFAADHNITLVNNAMMYLFKNAELQIGGQTVEHIDNPGQTTSILGYLSYPDDFNSTSSLSLCWLKDTSNNADSAEFTPSPAVTNAGVNAGVLTPMRNQNYNEGFAKRKEFINSSNPRGHFSFMIPFSHLFGFSEYDKFIYNTQMILRLTRDTDTLAIHKVTGVGDGKIKLTDIKWKVPEIKLAIKERTRALQLINAGKSIPVSYTRRTNYSVQIPEGVTTHTHRVSVMTGVEKPRWIILGFQTNRSRNQDQNPAIFDHVNLRKAYVQLNSEPYPKFPFNNDFERNDYCQLYNAMENFKKDYYGFNSLIGGTQISFKDFKLLFPIVVLDVRRQSEELKSGVVDIQIQLEFSQGIPAHTFMYAVVLSDSLYEFAADGSHMTLIRK